MSANLDKLSLRPIDRFHLAARMAEQGYLHRDPIVLLGAAQMIKTAGISWQNVTPSEDVAHDRPDQKSSRIDARPDPEILEKAIDSFKHEGGDLLAESLQIYTSTRMPPSALNLARIRIDAGRSQSFRFTKVAAICAAGDGAAEIELKLTRGDGTTVPDPDPQSNLSLICVASTVDSTTATIANLSNQPSDILLAWAPI